MKQQRKTSSRISRRILGSVFTLWAAPMFFGLALSSSSVKAVTPEIPECILPHGGGGDLPSPFSAVNQYVELAEGEIYTLTGTVVSGGGGHYFFRVDLDVQPWLANRMRRSNPNYPLEVSGMGWNRYLQKRVRITVMARGVYVFNSLNGNIRYQIALEPVDDQPIQLIRFSER